MGMSSGNSGPMGEINVTPLVDVMLVLLIIFMVTAPMMNAGIAIDLPKVNAPPVDMLENQVVLSIDADSNYYIDKSKFTSEEIAVHLAAIAKANPEAAVFLRADGTVPYAEVAYLLSVAKKSGIPRVGLVFDPGGDEAPK
jgi:biopolymer transport protein TolR